MQEIGDCSITAPDLTGHYRQVYLCQATHSQDYSLSCDTLCSENMFGDCQAQTATWYSVCGREHHHYQLWVAVTLGLAGLGSVVYAYALRDREEQSKEGVQVIISKMD